MRATVEQLKAMTRQEIYRLWSNGVFPFDHAICGDCLTTHLDLEDCEIDSHQPLIERVREMVGEYGSALELIQSHVEELYALRLFHDSLYPQTTHAEEKTADGLAIPIPESVLP